MLLVDERVGSVDLAPALKKYGLDVDLQHLEFGDVAFIGRGIAGADVFVGVELKETRDLISSMRSKRYVGHQQPGMIANYDSVWLLTEGIWRASDEGVLEELRGGWQTVSLGRQPVMAADVDAWLLSQIYRAGVLHRHTSTRRDTIRFIVGLYRWWTKKNLDEHRSHQAVYVPLSQGNKASVIDYSPFVKGMVGLVPNLGAPRAMALEEACKGSIRTLMGFSAKELQGIPGIGKVLAQKIQDALDGGAVPEPGL